MDVSTPQPEIPGFLLDRLIGEGGFGQVWHAHRVTDRSTVAIKVLHLELVRSIDALTRFQRELDATERLEHPNVVRALGHGTLDDGRPFLVLEYIEGPSLREVIQERGAIPPAEMLEILGPLCHALGVAHAAGLVHRDVKASNVILARGGDRPRPVLLDFGLVKLLDQVGPNLTSSRSMLGTPAAMAPEQMRGQPVDARTDVYALGLLVYHMLTGQPAFGGAPGVVQSYLQVHGPRPRPSAKVDIDPAIDAPVAKALAPEPDQRFPTAPAFLEALRAVISPAASGGIPVAVVALYVEGSPDQIALATSVIASQNMVVALAAPDSVLAVAPRGAIDTRQLREALAPLSDSKVAVGASTATLAGDVVDGDALDVEGWAPYPLPSGVWVAEDL
ncbi:MAG: serine/threonine protein kinase [Deltaproteobacteria bacterium]|nr:serine/threonine protein kinase [Deltaproteobacteria bacterium]